jgi:predicted DNA-binding WGR domain protein
VKYTLINVDENSNKFWQCVVNTDHITTKWGRIGTVGQSKDEYTSSPQYTANCKIKEKLKKGYYNVTEERFNIMTEIAKTLGIYFKIDELCFVTDNDCLLSHVNKENLQNPDVKPIIYVGVKGQSKHGNIPTWDFIINLDGMYQINLNKHTFRYTNKKLISNSILSNGINKAIELLLL